ncbi:transcription factor GTE3, chloroplastic-like isoform X2 [Drosophila pseudoobscura]|uniref:Transcription factor GTE3, chloroplastic-like isoform X2 n=1 Tax=Drosophila pseudoobscura pseudoobscura TaxID=46245 RepID=A0A6I8UZY4_DROPS|nr:transcription factor GTE3, chloroplastic isoform X2 [Drosophila pseudoobscura]
MNEAQSSSLKGFLARLESLGCDVPIPPRHEPKIAPVNGIVQPDVMPPPNRIGRTTNLTKKFRTVLDLMIRSKSSYQFRHPVNAVKLHVFNYHNLITRPMDLYTIKKRLENCYYFRAAEVLEDILLIFSNCRSFNSPQSPVFHDALALCDLLCARMAKLQGEIQHEVVEAPKIRFRASQSSKFVPLPVIKAPALLELPALSRGRGCPEFAAFAPRVRRFLFNEHKDFPRSYNNAGNIIYDATLVDYEIERSYGLRLLKFLRHKRRQRVCWAFNDSRVWMLLVGNQFVSFGWLQAMIRKMLENAMSCFTANPSVRMSAIRTQALVNKLRPKYLNRIARAKARALNVVRWKVEVLSRLS